MTPLLRHCGQEAAKDKLRANTDAAVAKGAFGVPTFIMDGSGELIFGNDRHVNRGLRVHMQCAAAMCAHAAFVAYSI
jgi:2-hydroxychromene-2-carboxylate isomerase